MVLTLFFSTGYSIDCAIKTDRIELPQDIYVLRKKKRVLKKINVYKKFNLSPCSAAGAESPCRSIDPFFLFLLIAICFSIATDWQKNDHAQVLVQ